MCVGGTGCGDSGHPVSGLDSCSSPVLGDRHHHLGGRRPLGTPTPGHLRRIRHLQGTLAEADSVISPFVVI